MTVITQAPARSVTWLIIALAAIAGLIFLALPAPSSVAAGDNAKWFVCKYVGTPGVDERLQTGQNPISVSENAIPVSPVVPGEFFQDAHGRSYVLVEDVGQAEPDPSECPPPDGGEPTPTPTPDGGTPTPTPDGGTPTPTPDGGTPTPTPDGGTPTPEGTAAGGTGTPAASVPDTATSFGGFGGPVATVVFGLILLGSLGALAYANVAAVRRRS